MAVLHLTKESFDKLKEQNGVMLVDFWATWCGPCKMIAPMIEKLAEEYEGKAVVAKVDVDQVPELAMEYGIQSIPNICIFKNGELVDRLVGAMPLSEFKRALDAVL